jgi:hypothetical protein
MSGPIVPPLEVTEVDGNPSGRPITKIIVSNGDLSISGRTATIDTSGSGGTPGGADTQVQYNNAGAFGGSADFTFTGIGGTDPTFTITASDGDVGTLTQENLIFDGGSDLCTIGTTTGDDGLVLWTGTHGVGGPYILLDALSSPSAMVIENAETDGTINIETSAGTGDITVNSNGDLNLYGDDNVILRHQSGGSVYATTATDEDAILGITSVGTGTPRLDIQSPSNRVWVLCDENKKLKIQGGAAGNTFVFDVSSASGGVTFPDGTTQSTAATGGGGGFKINGYRSFVSGTKTYLHQLGLGTSNLVTTTASTTAAWGNSLSRLRPIYARETGSFSNAYVNITVAAGSQVNGMIIGLYITDADGNPTSLKCTATLATTVIGQISAAWVAEAGQDLTCTQGDLFWVGWYRGDNATYKFVPQANVPILGYPSDSSTAALAGYTRYYVSGLPATITAYTNVDSGNWLCMWTDYS